MNVLLIGVDTLRWDHCGYNGAMDIKTPNLDRLAARATVFDRAIIGSFPTIAMRSDCLMGNYLFTGKPRGPITDDDVSLTDLLRDAGYYTGFVHDTVNIWQHGLGRNFHEDILTWDPPESRPRPEDISFPAPKEHIREEGAQRQRQLADMAHFRKESDWFCARTMTEAAEFLERNGRRDKWFLWVDTFEIHEVWHTPQYYIDLYDPGYDGPQYDFPNYGFTDIYTKKTLNHLRARYAAEVTLTDRWLGRLFDQLDVMDLWDDTMVVLISDHGMYIGEHGRTGKHTVDGNPWPLYEEVSHIPLLVRVPRRGVKRRVKALAQPVDLAPTILDVLGLKGPTMDGRSLWPVMRGKETKVRDAAFSQCRRRFEGPPAKAPTRLTVTTPKWTYIAAEPERPAELYDVRKDPGQKRNEIEGNETAARRLQKRAVRFLEEHGCPPEYPALYDPDRW